MTFLKNGRNKAPLDRVPSLVKALGVDPAYLMRLALDQAVGRQQRRRSPTSSGRRPPKTSAAGCKSCVTRRTTPTRGSRHGRGQHFAVFREMSVEEFDTVFTLPTARAGLRDHLTKNEQIWIEFVRVISGGRDPKIPPNRVRALRHLLDAGLGAEDRRVSRLPGRCD